MVDSMILEKFNVRRIVNAYGPATILGGSVLDSRVTAAMEQMSHSFVDMDELMEKSGRIVADLLGVESAMITTGAAAGLALSAAACMTGMDRSKIEALPETLGFQKNEIVVQNGHRNTYDRCLRVSGAKLISVGIPYLTHSWELESALTNKTAAIAHFTIATARPGLIGFDQVADIAKKHSLPLIVDGCNDVLPSLSNFSQFIRDGASLVVISGGKNIQGPNDTGIVCGKEDLVKACAANAAPHMHGIGRTMKVSKEQIVGLVTALEIYSQIDPKTRYSEWEKRLTRIQSELDQIPFVELRMVPEKLDLSKVPHLEIHLDESALGFSAREVVTALKSLEQPIVLDIGYWEKFRSETLFVSPVCMQDGDEVTIATELRRLFKEKSRVRELLARKNGITANAYP